MISTETVQELKSSVDLISIFKNYGVSPKKKGNSYLALCPFHKEKEPSLSINSAKNLWNCFGCGESGDAITLIQKLGNVDFKEAVEELAKYSGTRYKALGTSGKSIDAKTKMHLLNRVRDFYHRVFKERSEAKAYLESRGLTKYFEEYKLGYCDGSLLSTIPKDSELKDQLIELGILLESGRERFINCVIFPIEDEEGNTLSFYGRHIKMKDSGHFYLPGQKQGLFNIRQLKEKKAKTIIITESIIDSYSFINNELDNVMAIYGTNGLNTSHTDLLNKLKPKEIIIALDGDEQGKKASFELETQLKEKTTFSFNCQKICFPNGQDATEYFKTHTSAGSAKTDFEKLLKGNVDQIPTYKIKVTPVKPIIDLSRYELKHTELKNGKLTVTIKAINPTTKRFVLDTYNLYSQKQRQQLISAIAKLYQEPEPQIEKEVTDLIVLAEEQSKNTINQTNEPDQPTAKMSEKEEKEALAFLKSPNLLEQIVKDYQNIGYIGETINKKIAYLVMTSRKMQNPLSLVIMSNSAAGKSSLQKATLEFCPEAESKHFTRLTQQSLYYLGEDTLKHKFLSIEEEEGSTEASYSLKVLLSAKQLNVVTTVNDPTTGKKKAEEYTTEGPVAVMVSTTNPDLETELESRCLILSVDESSKQTGNIHIKQKQNRTIEGRSIRTNKEAIISKHKHAQMLLDHTLIVVNEYAPQLNFPSNRLRYRRTHDQYLDLIDTITFLRQHQKKIQKSETLGNYIEVEKEDIQTANEIITHIIGWTINELKPATISILKAIIQHYNDEGSRTFQRKQIRDRGNYSTGHLHRHLKLLEELEYIKPISGTNGTKYTYTLLYDGDGEETEQIVLGLTQVSDLKDPVNEGINL